MLVLKLKKCKLKTFFCPIRLAKTSKFENTQSLETVLRNCLWKWKTDHPFWKPSGTINQTLEHIYPTIHTKMFTATLILTAINVEITKMYINKGLNYGVSVQWNTLQLLIRTNYSNICWHGKIFQYLWSERTKKEVCRTVYGKCLEENKTKKIVATSMSGNQDMQPGELTFLTLFSISNHSVLF